ncbi:hypothetical protein [Streptomyces sp. 7N604]|uniref:hypothetical protein n=1 Tax=Streptomyces sp. 7N604 TaxID=3457415 RepID=UPI003FD1DD9E
MPEIHTYWIGGSPPDWAKQGLRNIQQQFPNEERNLWVLPSRIGPKNTGDETMRQLREAAAETGFQVHNVWDNLDQFAANMSRYNGDTLRDIIKWEMADKGEISVKDLTNFMVLGERGGLALDLSTYPTTSAVGNLQSLDKAEFKVPMLADDGIVRVIGNPSYDNWGSNAENQAEPHDLPHLDVWAMYARPGEESKGREVMQGAAEKMVGNYADLVNKGIRSGAISTRPGPDGEYKRERFMLAVVDPDSELGVKWSPGEEYRKHIIGQFAMSSLYDSIHGVYGQPKTPTHQSEMARFEVPRDTWANITWRTDRAADNRVVVPELGITKQYQNSWRQTNTDAVTRAMVSNMKLPGEHSPPGVRTPPPGESSKSSPTHSTATTPPSTSPGRGSPASR